MVWKIKIDFSPRFSRIGFPSYKLRLIAAQEHKGGLRAHLKGRTAFQRFFQILHQGIGKPLDNLLSHPRPYDIEPAGRIREKEEITMVFGGRSVGYQISPNLIADFLRCIRFHDPQHHYILNVQQGVENIKQTPNFQYDLFSLAAQAVTGFQNFRNPPFSGIQTGELQNLLWIGNGISILSRSQRGFIVF